MSPDAYNRDRVQSGAISIDDLAAVTLCAQKALGIGTDGMVGPDTLMAITRHLVTLRPATGGDLARMARAQIGDRYVFGATTQASDPNPSVWDCSQIVLWCCQQIGISIQDGSWRQYQACHQAGREIGIAKAKAITGALLFRFDGDPMRAERPRAAHVAISLGNGRTIEAKSPRAGVLIDSATGRGWTHAGLVPGLVY